MEGVANASFVGPRVNAARSRGAEFHIPSLDGIRALSFLIVFVAHAGLGDVVPGGFGVTCFFFLSGYLITTLLRIEFERTGTISLRDFYLRRALRILPPFYSVLALAALLTATHVLPGGLDAQPMIAQLAHVTNYWNIYFGTAGMPQGTGVYWSLAVEEHFYLLFPCLFILLQLAFRRRPRMQGGALLLVCAAVLAWRLALVLWLGATGDRTYLASDTRLDSILFGCALAVAANPMIDQVQLTARWRTPLLVLGTAGLLFSFLFRAPWFRETLRYSVQGLSLAPLFVVAMREPDYGPFKLLNLRLVRRVGVLSYSLYLVHHVALYATEAWLPRAGAPVRALLALGLSLAVAQATYRLIEKPCARLRKRFAHAHWMGPGPTGRSRDERG